VSRKCQHGKAPTRCLDCGGGSFCEHRILRFACAVCKGCEHGRLRNQCRDCKGKHFCEHKRRRRNCKECKGASVCEHNRIRYACKDCIGSSICEHKRERSRCRLCKGGGICEHKKVRCKCPICRPDNFFKEYVYTAKRRGYSFTLTLEEFKALIVQHCFYCGEREEPRGIDRWDNNIGYALSNCRPCCSTCNYMKRAMDGAVFVDHLQHAADYTQAVEQADLQQQFSDA
jgi:hypothetical protein